MTNQDIAPLEPGWVAVLDVEPQVVVDESAVIICWRVTGAPDGTTLVLARYAGGRRIDAQGVGDPGDSTVTVECPYAIFVQLENGADPALAFMRNDMKHDGDHAVFLVWLRERSAFLACR